MKEPLETQREMKRLRKRPGHKFKNFKADHKLRQQTLYYAIFSKKMALTPDNDVPLPENIQAKDKIYPPVISLVISIQIWRLY